MQSPAHFLIGAAICRQVRCKPLGLVLALASHFALDALPHFEDPSILPQPVAPIAGRHWDLLLAGAQVVVVVIAAITWWRFRRVAGATVAATLYLIAGGLVACSPDYLHWIGGAGGPVNELNEWSHRWWFEPYLRYVRAYPQNRPWVAGWCLFIESAVCLVGGLGLFGGAQQWVHAQAQSQEQDRCCSSA